MNILLRILPLFIVYLLNGKAFGATRIEENIEYYTVSLTRTETRCYTCSYTTCNDFKDYQGYLCYRKCCLDLVYSYWYLYVRSCKTTTTQNCCPYTVPYTETRSRCKTGWTNYPYCDVAICNPQCGSGYRCIRPNEGVCETLSNGVCTNDPCSNDVNCYPGTCKDKTTLTCTCPPGFEGRNCINLTLAPDIKNCKAILFANPDGTEKAVGVVNECAALGLDPQTVWVGLSARKSDGTVALTRLDVSWDAVYNDPITLPNRQSAPFVSNSPTPIGIKQSEYRVEVQGSGASVTPVTCPIRSPLPTVAQCPNIVSQWNNLGITSVINHNASLLITISAQMGGEKVGTNGFFPTQQFQSSATSRQMLLNFDFRLPSHCVLDDPANCDVFPIYLNETVTRNKRIQPIFSSWRDDGSGIKNFRAEAFKLNINADNVLEEIGTPIRREDGFTFDFETSSFIADLPGPGVYSVHVTAFDWAGNSAKARKILTVYDGSSLTKTDATIIVEGADPNSDYRFITSLQPPASGDYQFTARWTDLFKSTLKPEWLLPVKPLPLDAGIIDDIFGTRYGLRSTNPLEQNIGILAYEFEYDVFRDGGLGAQPTFNGTGTSKPEISFNVRETQLIEEGSTIVMWVSAYDLEGDKYTKEMRVSVHRDRTDIKLENFELIPRYQDPYMTGVKLNVESPIGGVKNMTFRIYDKTLRKYLTGEEVVKLAYRDWPYNPSTREKRQVPDTPNACKADDNTCYCIPAGICFNTTQYLVIDNCWIDLYDGHSVDIQVQMRTISGYNVSNTFPFTVDRENMRCRPKDPNGLTGGEIAAIVICSIIGLLLLLLLLLLLWRWRQKKHPVPTRVRTILNDFRNRATKTHTTENELYATNDKDDLPKPYVKNDLELAKVGSSNAGYSPPNDHEYQSLIVYNSKNLNVGTQTLGEGRFATIKNGTLHDGNHRITVAIKALRNGYTKPDADLMQIKIKELASLPHHPNIVNLKGVYKDDVSGRAPSMVLDYCDRTLTDWLESLGKVDPETLDTMHNYSKDIACGMEHLHDNGIVHRKLTAKNVLLSSTPHGTIAKVTGFGPSKDDSSDGGQRSLVKVKWLAPETIASLKSDHPRYDEKTDAWSYGVTLWEMYSKGEAPYGNIKSSELLNQLQRGYRLPRPEYCAPELYTDIMQPCWDVDSHQRPDLGEICRRIDRFRSSDDNPQGYYGADELGIGGYRSNIPSGYYTPDKLNTGYGSNGKLANEYRESNNYTDAS